MTVSVIGQTRCIKDSRIQQTLHRVRLHVRFCVQIGVRFGKRSAAQGVPKVIFDLFLLKPHLLFGISQRRQTSIFFCMRNFTSYADAGLKMQQQKIIFLFSAIVVLVLFFFVFFNNTLSLFVGQIFIRGDHYSLYQFWHVTNCMVEFSSFRSSPVDSSGSTFFFSTWAGRAVVLLLQCLVRIFVEG
jgi:hypothetical protein